MSDRKFEPLTPENWAWLDRNRHKTSDYYAMEFAAMLDRARDEIKQLRAQSLPTNSRNVHGE